VVLVGTSGSGKSSLLNALSGFMAYTGSLRINKTELRDLILMPGANSSAGWDKTRSYLPPRCGRTCFWRARMRAKMSCNRS
jgi:ABC-type transport system involved in cytochrome bd biosynthesis fused ATPase/permease subunit